MKKITVIIVDDSAFIRRLFQDLLADEADIEVVDTAHDPYDARDKIKLHNPDVLTLDIEMPKMDGLSFLEKIMSLRPMPVIMASSLTQKGAQETIRALELGAVDYISKPVGAMAGQNLHHLKYELTSKIRMAAQATVRPRTHAAPKPVLSYTPSGNVALVAMGSSTGGVEALRDIFRLLPANMPPIMLTQHMPQQFIASFAARLDSLSAVTVQEARNGERLKPGHAYIAPGNAHLKISKLGSEHICRLENSELVSGHRPSVDVLFHSVAQLMGPRAVGVILTGMGRDGAEGLKAMHDAGARTLGQNQATCVVYGMPKSAVALGGVDKELPLGDIAQGILTLCHTGGAHGT